MRDNEDKLARIFRKLEGFDLPYDYQSRDEIQDVWESLFESLELKQKLSFVARKIEDAEEAGDLDMLLLSEEEKVTLRRELS